MSKVKILEVNKNLTNYTQEVLERVISTQNESQDQLQKAKKLETDLIARIREREERKALAKHEEEVRAQKEQEEAVKAAQKLEQRAQQAPDEKPVEIKDPGVIDKNVKEEPANKEQPTAIEEKPSERKIEEKPQVKAVKEEAKGKNEETVAEEKKDKIINSEPPKEVKKEENKENDNREPVSKRGGYRR